MFAKCFSFVKICIRIAGGTAWQFSPASRHVGRVMTPPPGFPIVGRGHDPSAPQARRASCPPRLRGGWREAPGGDPILSTGHFLPRLRRGRPFESRRPFQKKRQAVRPVFFLVRIGITDFATLNFYRQKTHIFSSNIG